MSDDGDNEYGACFWIIALPASFWEVFVLWKLWHWFVVPVFGFPMGYGAAFGLVILIDAIRMDGYRMAEEFELEEGERSMRGCCRMLFKSVAYLVMLVVGAVVNAIIH